MTAPTLPDMPDDVTDPQAWRTAHAIMNQHRAYPGSGIAYPAPGVIYPGTDLCETCGQPSPCPTYVKAHRETYKARRPWWASGLDHRPRWQPRIGSIPWHAP